MRTILRRSYSSFAYIKRWAEKSPELITIDNLKQSEKYNKPYLKTVVSNEVKNRIAGQIISLESLPYGLSKTSGINSAIFDYIKSFNELKCLNDGDNDNFGGTVENILDRHKDVSKDIMVGIHEWKNDIKQKYNIDYFQDFAYKIDTGLNDFFHKRMSTRLIIMNYLSILNRNTSIIDSNIDIIQVINDAYDNAKTLCDDKYGVSPGIDIKNEFKSNFMYIEPNLKYIIHELLKNSMEAVVIKYKVPSQMPKISIRVHEYNNKPILRIHDEGVGVSVENLDAIWSYFYSTSNKSLQNIQCRDELDKFIDTSKLSGFGFGMCTSKLFVEYFGGRITFNSVLGSCSDVYIYF